MFALILLSGASLIAQTPLRPTFDVASVKPSPPQPDGNFETGGGSCTSNAARASWTGMSLKVILMWAYGVRFNQIAGSPEMIAQLNSQHYDIVAKVPAGATKDQCNLMLQNLLIERFHLALHHETRDFDGYELVIGKNGSKLKPSSPEDMAFDQSAGGLLLAKDANGIQQLVRPGAIPMLMQPGSNGRPTTILMLCRAQPIDQLLMVINMNVDKPWVDKTGLTGKYDYRMEFVPENLIPVMSNGDPLPPPPAKDRLDDPAPNLFSALQQQLGLRLDSKKIPFDVLVIEHADKVPTEN